VRLEVDEATTPGEVGKRTPLGRDEWRVIAILAWTDDTGVLIERKGDVGFEG